MKSLSSRACAWLFLVGLVALAGCRPLANVTPRELHLNLGIEPATLDPALATDPNSLQVVRMLFSSLVETDAETGAPQHGLSNGWAVSADGLLWEFKLRDDANWVRYIPSTNKIEVKRPVTAQDVVYSVRRLFDPRTGSGFASVFAPLIRGGEQLHGADPRKTSDAVFQQLFANLGVQAVDDTIVRFTLTRPAVYFPSIVSTWLVRLQPREAIESGGPVWTEPGTLWTTGPYVLERWQHGRELVLKKNDNWYDAGTVHIGTIQFVMIADTASALEEYKNGGLDTLDPYDGLAQKDVDDLREDPVLGSQLRFIPTLCTHFYGFNTAKAPFNDPLVRKAFITAIDRETLATSVVKLGEPARWFTRPGIFGSPDISDTLGIGTAYNANKAREYLKEGGYDKKRLGTITLAVNTSDENEVIAETVVQMWKNDLGVEVNVNRLDWKQYLQTLRTDTPQIFRFGYCAYYPDASNFLESMFRSRAPDNFTHWSSAQLDQLVDSAAREIDLDKRRAAYRAAEKILIEDQAVIVPLWWSTRATLAQPGLVRTYAITEGYDRLEQWSLP